MNLNDVHKYQKKLEPMYSFNVPI